MLAKTSVTTAAMRVIQDCGIGRDGADDEADGDLAVDVRSGRSGQRRDLEHAGRQDNRGGQQEGEPGGVIDIRMPPTGTREGIQAALEIRELFPAVGILLLSTYAQIDDAVELFSATASHVGYLLKDSVSDLDELIDALTRISAGGTVLDPNLVIELLAATRRADPLHALTPREREVLMLVAQGQSNAGIAKTLWITHGAVEKHIKHIFAKLGIPATADIHRRVLAAITFLETR